MKQKYSKKYVNGIYEHFGELLFNEKGDVIGVPSLSSFARSIGVRLSSVMTWKSKHPEFEDAISQCELMQKQLIIDAALCKKVDGSFAKFYLTAMFGLGAKTAAQTGSFSITDTDRHMLETIAKRLNGEETEE